MQRVENDHVVESTTEARAAVSGHNVRYVLVLEHRCGDRALRNCLLHDALTH